MPFKGDMLVPRRVVPHIFHFFHISEKTIVLPRAPEIPNFPWRFFFAKKKVGGSSGVETVKMMEGSHPNG